MEKTTRPFRYDLNKIPYDYTVEMTNRFKGLDLIECLENYGWSFVMLFRRQWLKPPQEKEIQQGKMVIWGGLTNSWEKKRSERQRGKERYTQLNPDFQRIAMSNKKAFLSKQCKEIEENNRTGKIRHLFKNMTDAKGNFMQRWAQ